MRKCPACDEPNDHNTVTCAFCGYRDIGWESTLRLARLGGWHLTRRISSSVAEEHIGARAPIAPDNVEHTIPVTSFTEAGEYAHELRLFEHTIAWEANLDAPYVTPLPLKRYRLTFDFRPVAHDFDSSVSIDDYSGDVLPASVGIVALSDARRAIEVAQGRYRGAVNIAALLPPSSHPVTHFLQEANLIPDGVCVELQPTLTTTAVPFGALETIVPAYEVVQSQLPNSTFSRLDELVAAGRISGEYRRHLRHAVMEIADNGFRHGNGRCTIAVFLRNESATRTDASVHLPLTADDARKVHLFVLCYTIGPTLADTLNVADDREAVAQIMSRDISSSLGGGLGLGLGGALCKARDKAEGTIMVSSGRYTRVDMPNRMVREWTAEAGSVLPGVSTCLLVPLAKVAALSVPRAS